MFSVDVEPGGLGCVIALRGELDFNSAVQLREAVDAVLAGPQPPEVVVIDCSALTFCDSSGINALITTHQRLAAYRGVLRLAAAPGSVTRVFALTGLDQVIGLYGTVADASAAEAGGPAPRPGDGSSSPQAASER
ncbi:anti-sigma factor antagonist [Streptomyces sp. Y2F8-2]|nr:anti-sigma factor antagonist [Streptomyces sp. Y2F8-2]